MASRPGDALETAGAAVGRTIGRDAEGVLAQAEVRTPRPKRIRFFTLRVFSRQKIRDGPASTGPRKYAWPAECNAPCPRRAASDAKAMDASSLGEENERSGVRWITRCKGDGRTSARTERSLPPTMRSDPTVMRRLAALKVIDMSGAQTMRWKKEDEIAAPAVIDVEPAPGE